MFYKNQIPLLALLSDKDYDEVDFYISNHDSACSSIFKFTNEINNSEWKITLTKEIEGEKK